MKPRIFIFAALLLATPLPAQEKPDAGTTAATAADDAKQNTEIKLAHIILPKIEFKDASLRDAMDWLRRWSVKYDVVELDSAKKGIQFKMGLNPDAGPAASPSPEAVRFDLTLSNLPIGEALHYITNLASVEAWFDPAGAIVILRPGAKAPRGWSLVEFMPPEDPDKVEISLTHKLDRLIIPKLVFRGATLDDAIAFLRARSAAIDAGELDPARRGINLIVVGSPGFAEQKITFSAEKIPLSEAIRKVAKLAGMQVRIDPYVVVLVPRKYKTRIIPRVRVDPYAVALVPGDDDGKATAQ